MPGCKRPGVTNQSQNITVSGKAQSPAILNLSTCKFPYVSVHRCTLTHTYTHYTYLRIIQMYACTRIAPIMYLLLCMHVALLCCCSVAQYVR